MRNPATRLINNYTACLLNHWKGKLRKTHQQFCLNTLYADKRTRGGKRVAVRFETGLVCELMVCQLWKRSLLLKLCQRWNNIGPNHNMISLLAPFSTACIPRVSCFFFLSLNLLKVIFLNQGVKKQRTQQPAVCKTFTFVDMLCHGGLSEEKGEPEEREERQSSPLGHHFSQINLCRLQEPRRSFKKKKKERNP